MSAQSALCNGFHRAITVKSAIVIVIYYMYCSYFARMVAIFDSSKDWFLS